MVKQRIFVLISILLLAAAVSGCSGPQADTPQPDSDTGFVAAVPGNYDSADTAVLIQKDTENQKMTFLNLTLGKYYTLSYDGATAYADKYDQPLSVRQIQEGELVDITFMKMRRRLNTMKLSPAAFRFENYTNAQFEGNRLTIGKEEYTLDKNVSILNSSGLLELMDLASVDSLTILGMDHTIYSIIVENGHGYLRLTNDSYFLGGWIEIDGSYIYPITENMLLTVPAGTCKVTVSASGSVGSETLVVQEREEAALDVSKWQGEEKTGTIVFAVHPDTTRIYVDGASVDVSEPQELSYGIHQMIAIADGYETISRYIKVNAEYASMEVTLNARGDSASGNSASGNSVSVNGISDNSVSGSRITQNTSANSVSSNAVSANRAQETAGSISSNASETSSAREQAEKVREEEKASRARKPLADEAASSDGKSRIYIDGPQDVEVYVDGSYVGIAPVSFEKTAGSHAITLRKNGYQTRTYSIAADTTDKDVNYSFSELLPISD